MSESDIRLSGRPLLGIREGLRGTIGGVGLSFTLSTDVAIGYHILRPASVPTGQVSSVVNRTPPASGTGMQLILGTRP